MIRALTKIFVAVAALVGLAGTANASLVAASWTRQRPRQQDCRSTAAMISTYTHDLTDDGFRPLTDLITRLLSEPESLR